MPRRVRPAGSASVGSGQEAVRAAESLVVEKDGLLRFPVRVQPRSSRLGVAGLRGGALKVQLTAPALQDRANRQLLEFVASGLGVPKSAVRLLSGARGRDKTVGVEGLSRESLVRWLARRLD